MRFLMPIIFLIVAAGAVFGLTIMNAPKGATVAAKAEPVTTEGEERSNGFSLALAALLGEPDAAPIASGSDKSLASFFPDAPTGWTREVYATEHGELLTGTTFRPGTVGDSTTNVQLETMLRARDHETDAAFTYTNGTETVLISISSLDVDTGATGLFADVNEVSDQLEQNLAYMTLALADASSGAALPFANLHGVGFRFAGNTSTGIAQQSDIPVNYRTLKANLSWNLTFTVMTNASDASIATILSGIDIPGMNATLENPDANVTPGTGLITVADGPLSTEPPAPSLRYQAYDKLRTEAEDLSQEDVRLLQAMSKGDIDGWVDIYDARGLRHNLSKTVAAILGPEPELPAALEVKYRAKLLLQSVGIHSKYEVKLLEALASGRVDTQGGAQRLIERNRYYAPPVLALVAKLPIETEVAAADETTATPEAELIIRRGIQVEQGAPLAGNCVIELGVRYCTVDEPTD